LLAVLVLGTLVREARACHHYANWKYPYPQRCSVAPERDWYVEITGVPLRWEGEPAWAILVGRLPVRIPVMGE
jgi:hypothetical protein